MLSSQTRDQVTFAAMEKLKKHGLTPEKVMKMTEEEIGNLIRPVGFWKVVLFVYFVCYSMTFWNFVENIFPYYQEFLLISRYEYLFI